MNVGEICCRDVVIAGKQDSIFMVARLMRDHQVSNVVMVESRNGINVPLGVLSDRDIVIKIIAEGLDLNHIRVGDIINGQVLTAHEGDDVTITLKRMRHSGIRRVPIVSQDNGLIGILSIDDILDTVTEQLNDIDQIIAHEHTRAGWSHII